MTRPAECVAPTRNKCSRCSAQAYPLATSRTFIFHWAVFQSPCCDDFGGQPPFTSPCSSKAVHANWSSTRRRWSGRRTVLAMCLPSGVTMMCPLSSSYLPHQILRFHPLSPLYSVPFCVVRLGLSNGTRNGITSPSGNNSHTYTSGYGVAPLTFTRIAISPRLTWYRHCSVHINHHDQTRCELVENLFTSRLALCSRALLFSCTFPLPAQGLQRITPILHKAPTNSPRGHSGDQHVRAVFVTRKCHAQNHQRTRSHPQATWRKLREQLKQSQRTCAHQQQKKHEATGGSTVNTETCFVFKLFENP